MPQHHEHHHNGIVRHAGRGVGYIPYADTQRVGIVRIHMFHANAAGHAQPHAVLMVKIPKLRGNRRVGQNVDAVCALGEMGVFRLGTLGGYGKLDAVTPTALT